MLWVNHFSFFPLCRHGDCADTGADTGTGNLSGRTRVVDKGTGNLRRGRGDGGADKGTGNLRGALGTGTRWESTGDRHSLGIHILKVHRGQAHFRVQAITAIARSRSLSCPNAPLMPERT